MSFGAVAHRGGDVQLPLVNRVRLPVARLDDTDTATGNVAEPDVEATELVANDDEHAEGLLRVLNFG